jgi:hypothetical protein
LKTTFFARISIPLLVCAVVLGVFFNYTGPQNINSKKQCTIELTQKCVVFDNGQQISVQFLQEMELEEEILINIIIPKNSTIKNMWVQGINMYMGKTAIITDNTYVQDTQKVYNARLFLGACSEPAMKWQMIIQTSTNNELMQSWFFNFSTNRNKKAE